MFKDKQSYIYIMASDRNATIYTGSTTDLVRRVWEHKNKVFDGFASKHSTNKLVFYEVTPDLDSALVREKRIKKWNRAWKIELIEEMNPYWNDLYESLL